MGDGPRNPEINFFPPKIDPFLPEYAHFLHILYFALNLLGRRIFLLRLRTTLIVILDPTFGANPICHPNFCVPKF